MSQCLERCQVIDILGIVVYRWCTFNSLKNDRRAYLARPMDFFGGGGRLEEGSP